MTMPGFDFTVGGGPTEPSADARGAAQDLWRWNVALQSQGFTGDQALYLIGQSLSGAAMGQALGQAMNGGGS